MNCKMKNLYSSSPMPPFLRWFGREGMTRFAICVAVGILMSFRCAAAGQNLGGDMALSLVLIDGEEWQKVAGGYQFTDAACGDTEGNFYFADVTKGTAINRITADG